MPSPLVTGIDRIPAGMPRPLWSVMIPTYNCANYLTKALESVLAQDPGPEHMQIEVVDDCSTEDDPAAVVREIGKGRVRFHRNKENVRNARNFNVSIARSRGYLVHILNGDDYIGSGFYNKMAAAAGQSDDCAAIFCRSFIVNPQEKHLGVSEFCSSLREVSRDPREFLMVNPIRTPGVIVRRSFYEQYGGFDPDFLHIHDWEIWVRAIVHGGARMLNEPLAYYRVHNQNDTSRVSRSAINLQDQYRLSAKWQAERLQGFDRLAFDWQTTRVAAVRALLFALRGDLEAAAANWQVWRDHAAIGDIPRACFDTFLTVGSTTARHARESLRARRRPSEMKIL